MKNIITKAGLGVALAVTALTTAAPAEAQRYRGYRHYDRGGDVATGAIVGGILGLGIGAAIASSSRNRYDDRGYYNQRGNYNQRGYYDQRAYYGPPVYQNRYRPVCRTRFRFDPYYGRRIPVRICR